MANTVKLYRLDAEAVRRIVQEQGCTAGDVALQGRFSVDTARRVLRTMGAGARFSFKTCSRMARGLGVDVDTILEGAAR